MKKFLEKKYITSSNETITFQTGKIANRSDSSVIVKCGDTVLLITVTCDKSNSKEFDFLPLHVDYQEKNYAVAKIPSNNSKREGKLNNHEILISRLIDRCVRPLFDKDFRNSVDINVVLLSHDKDIFPETLACFGSSLALMLSSVPIACPASEVVVYLINNKWVLNPKISEVKNVSTKMIVGGSIDSIIMLEGKMCELDDEKIIEGINLAVDEIKKQCIFQQQFLEEYDIIPKITINNSKNVFEDDVLVSKIFKVFEDGIKEKEERNSKLSEIINNFKNEQKDNAENILKASKKRALRNLIFKEGKRIDGRDLCEIREISCEVDILPSSHGSALFTRGETQALVTVTIGDKRDSQIRENITNPGFNNFILHYNFPNYSVGEIGSKNNVGRREIGHGNLALNGLEQMIEKDDLNNYVIRVCSDILSSDGSSSMATVCGSSMALMDAGIKIIKPVAGIAMGILFDDNENYKILSDISEEEDGLGDMDFKIIATDNGINAIQLDVKILKLTNVIISDVLKQSHIGINNILNIMNKTISKHRESVKDFAPCYKSIEIDRGMISQLIGFKGSTIQKIQRETNCFIFIDEKAEKGIINISSPNKRYLDSCIVKINKIIDKILCTNPVVGKIYNEGIVVEIKNDFVRVEFLPGKRGILKIEDIDWHINNIKNIKDILRVGDLISVKLMCENAGEYILSHKVLIDKPKEEILKSNKDKKHNLFPPIPENI